MVNHPDVAPGLYGTGITILGAIAAFCAAAIPVLQFCVLVTTFIAGVLTSVWTYKKIRSHNLEAAARVAAAEIKAKAVVVAKALDEAK